jgi:hypothetical protein
MIRHSAAPPHVHAPAVQPSLVLESHTWPHAPQLFTLRWMFVQVPPQQSWFALQVTPQPPQFVRVVRAVHAPPQHA